MIVKEVYSGLARLANGSEYATCELAEAVGRLFATDGEARDRFILWACNPDINAGVFVRRFCGDSMERLIGALHAPSNLSGFERVRVALYILKDLGAKSHPAVFLPLSAYLEWWRGHWDYAASDLKRFDDLGGHKDVDNLARLVRQCVECGVEPPRVLQEA